MDAVSRDIRLLVEYDGTPYVGWQIQENLPSVQGHITDALQQIIHGETITLLCAGRTDGGVHALGQIASFRTRWRGEARRLTPALNHYLPGTIRVHRSDDAPAGFDPRQASKSKIYRYRIYQGPHAPALDRRRAWHIRRKCDTDAMRAAIPHLLGELDFESFRSAHCDANHAIRRMLAIDVITLPRGPVGTFVDIVFHANAFCRHMCRILAGTLLEVGVGLRSAGSIPAVLEARDRRRAGMTAPAWGLYLERVLY